MTDEDRPIVTARAYIEARLEAAGATLESARLGGPVVVALDSFLARLREAEAIEEREHPFLRRVWTRDGAFFVESRIGSPNVISDRLTDPEWNLRFADLGFRDAVARVAHAVARGAGGL